jgi:hypothetical protein
MPKYTFSQGKVSLEDGFFRPAINLDKGRLESVVLIVLPLSAQSKASIQDKEKRPHKKSR